MRFTETQRFTQKWVWAIILLIAGMSIYGGYQQLVLGVSFGNNPVSDPWMFVIILLVGIGFPVSFYSMKLETKVTDALYVRFFPFHLRFKKIEYESCKPMTYRPILDYGGWGIRWGRNGKVYNVSGNQGVMFKLKDGKSLMIGSQRSDEFVESLQALK